MTTHEPYIVAAHITGKVTADADCICRKDKKDGKDDESRPTQRQRTARRLTDDKRRRKRRRKKTMRLAGKEPEKTEIDVVLVADIDWILRRTSSGSAKLGRIKTIRANRVQIPERAVRAEHPRLAGGRRPVHRPAEAHAVASHSDEGRRSDRRSAQGSRSTSRRSSSAMRGSRSKRPRRNFARRLPSWKTARTSIRA